METIDIQTVLFVVFTLCAAAVAGFNAGKRI